MLNSMSASKLVVFMMIIRIMTMVMVVIDMMVMDITITTDRRPNFNVVVLLSIHDYIATYV